MIGVLTVVCVSAAAIAFAMRPSMSDPLAMWGTLALAYGALASLAAFRLHKRGRLVEMLTPRWGDPSIGAITGLLLLAATWIGRSQLMPSGSSRQAWLVQLYWLLGDPSVLQRSVHLSALILFVPACEELVWRGLVLDSLTERFGRRRGWPLSALLYALVAAPTAFTLSIPGVGFNPLLMLAALGCGLVWGFMANQSRRLPAVILSHMAFTYFSSTQFRLPGM